jgi:hypothetical protein
VTRGRLAALSILAAVAAWLLWPRGGEAPGRGEPEVPANAARGERDGLVFWAVAPRRIPVFRESEGTQRTPHFIVTLAIDNDAYRVLPFDRGTISWDLALEDPDGRVVRRVTGEAPPPAGGELLPGERWSQSACIEIPPGATAWSGGEYAVRVSYRVDGGEPLRIETHTRIDR